MYATICGVVNPGHDHTEIVLTFFTFGTFHDAGQHHTKQEANQRGKLHNNL